MQGDDDRSVLNAGAEQLGLSLDEENLNALVSFKDLLLQWNSSFNLVGKSDLPDLVSRHLLDCLAVNPFLEGSYIVDIGSGAGLPGIPLAILNPEKRFVLLDSNGKKTRFLFQAKLNLGLANVEVENCRVEHYQSHRQIDIVICRAFSDLADILTRARAMFTRRTSLLAMKGQYPGDELEKLPGGFSITAVHKLVIPGVQPERHLVVIRNENHWPVSSEN